MKVAAEGEAQAMAKLVEQDRLASGAGTWVAMGSMLTALARPQTYVAYANETLNLARSILRYPLGVVEAALRTGAPSGEREHDTPVLLVHGFGHNRSGWHVLDRALRGAGFTSVHTMNYLPFTASLPHLAERPRDRVEDICRTTGSDRVHVVGHSMGGVLLRWYVQELGGGDRVDTAITIASPHDGTEMARWSIAPSARDLHPDSWVVRTLRHGKDVSETRWVAYYSNVDIVVRPATSARLDNPTLAATNILVKDAPHLSIMMSPFLVRSILAQLELREREHAAGRRAAEAAIAADGSAA